MVDSSGNSSTVTKSSSSSHHYVNNKDLLAAIVKFRKEIAGSKRKKLDRPTIPKYIGECIMIIAYRLSTRPNFRDYSFVEDMRSDGVENCISYIDNFDPLKSDNPFAYFTQIIWFAFLRRIQKERKQTYIKHKSFENAMIFHDIHDQMYGQQSELVAEGEPASAIKVTDADQSAVANFIASFEESMKTKRAERNSKKPPVEKLAKRA